MAVQVRLPVVHYRQRERADSQLHNDCVLTILPSRQHTGYKIAYVDGIRQASGADSLEQRRTVGEGWFCRGALRGRSPCTREGRRPDRP